VILSTIIEMEANTMAEITGFTPAPVTTVTAPQPFTPGIHIQSQFDVIDVLPPGAQDRLRKLRLRRADAHRLIPEFEQIREASAARIEAEHALKRLTSHPQDGGFGLAPDDRRVIAPQQHLEKMTADFKRLTELQKVRSGAFQSTSAAQSNVEDWLRHGVPGNCQIAEIEVEPPKLNKGEDILSALEKVRRRGRELKADLARIAAAPFPSAYCKQRMREQIETLAMQGAPSVARLVELDGPVDFQTQRLTSEVHAERRLLAFTEAPDALALTCYLQKDALIKRLDAEIDAEADDKAALSHEARQKAEAEVRADLLSVERDESALVWQAQAQGLPIEHRSDINPVALLGLRLVTTARVNETPQTTVGYSWPMRR
jgi:hypothetical protein